MTPNESVMNRYAEGYANARAITTFGTFIKRVEILIGVAMGAGGESLWRDLFDRRYPMLLFLFFCGLFIFSMYIVGVLVCAQGESLKATLDSAVNNSPFLSNEERIKVMSFAGFEKKRRPRSVDA